MVGDGSIIVAVIVRCFQVLGAGVVVDSKDFSVAYSLVMRYSTNPAVTPTLLKPVLGIRTSHPRRRQRAALRSSLHIP